AFVRRDARPVIGDHQLGVRRVELPELDTDVTARWAPLGRVVQQVQYRPREPTGVAEDLPSDDFDVEVNIVAPPTNSFQASIDDLGHVDLLMHDGAGIV